MEIRLVNQLVRFYLINETIFLPAYGDKICYNCGHRTLPDGTTEALPDTALCGDFANSDDITTTCGDGDDCCASVEAYFTK